MQALRLTAMGRAGHPLQEQLADELAKLTAQAVSMDDCGRPEPAEVPVPMPVVESPKRGPGRPKKAE